MSGPNYHAFVEFSKNLATKHLSVEMCNGTSECVMETLEQLEMPMLDQIVVVMGLLCEWF